MLDNITIARPYAQAVFEHAREEGDIPQWSALLKRLAMIVSDPQMRVLFGNPKVSHEQLEELVCGLCNESLSATGRNFIKILIQAGRLRQAAGISALFEDMWAEAEGRMEIDVITAYELDSGQENRISAAMAKRLKKKITVLPAVDTSLIGGIIIRAGDSVIDASLRGRLVKLRNELIR